ncbi:Transcription initiation factor TFIID subunit 13 [Penicillium mononematosum]|uniref:Transcription initiation factor TFIID subunit 13 n=1 Tax=Penicillium mononematosum TaxID=268346 RepID=UPI0025490317|nr:Transcription initiation factor TFIID subunit 13 [Penicillium mononematosum]KAJ6190178.1 Transcription initiation factor TFIID subunit 13 [Penicillium mononematosum]
MSAKRTGQMSKRVSFSLPDQSPAAPSTPTPQRVLNPHIGLPTPDTSTPISSAHYQTPNTASPTPNCQLQIPNTPTPNTFSPSSSHLHTPNSSLLTTRTGLPSPTRNPSRQPSSKNLVSRLSPNWYFNEQDTELIRAGYEPQWSSKPADTTSTSTAKGKKEPATKSAMAEPRARMARHKGQMNFQNELRLLLLAYGDPSPHPSFPNEPLPETVRVLDEIVTDFVLELSHGAAQVAHHARRQKIKVEDFRFALRRDPNKLGRVQELLRMERELKEARKAFDQNDDQVAKEAGKKGAAAAAAAAAAGEDPVAAEAAATATVTKKSKGKGKRGAAIRRGSDATEESVSKKRKTIG